MSTEKLPDLQNYAGSLYDFPCLIVQGKIIYATEESCRLLGYSFHEITDMNISCLASRNGIFPEIFERLASGEGKAYFGKTLFANAGNNDISMYIYMDKMPVFGEKTPVSICMMPVSEGWQEAQAETVLKTRMALFNIFMQNASPVLLLDRRGFIIKMTNFSAARLYGGSIAMFKDVSYFDMDILLPELIKQEITYALEGRQRFFLTKHRRFDGEVMDISVKISTFNGMNKHYFIMEIQDITQRKAMEKRTDEKKEQFRELNRTLTHKINTERGELQKKEQAALQKSRLSAMQEMIGAVAHEWRQPLNALGLLIQDLEDAWQFEELSQDYITKFVKEGMGLIDEMSYTIDNFRSFFKTSARQEFFNLVKMFGDITRFMGLAMEHSGVWLTVVYRAEDGSILDRPLEDQFRIYGYPNEFKQAIVNILHNSRMAIERKFPKADQGKSGNINIIISLREENILIDIQDSRGGVAEEIPGKIIEPDVTSSEDGENAGIGLYMAKAVIEMNMGGTLKAATHREGLRISLTLPRRQQE